MNLTGVAERGRMIIELFLDSLIPVPYLPSTGRMLDIGSGAGFPAVVIKVLVPGFKLNMVEANSKKVSFLKQIIRLLKLDETEVINNRIEKIRDKPFLNKFDIISSRALANLNQIINWCAPLIADEGLLIYFSGSSVEENIKSCEYQIKNNNLILTHSIPYHLPGLRVGRSVVILKKEMIK